MVTKVLKYPVLFLFLFLVNSITNVAQVKHIKFDKISLEHGLSQSSVYSIIQDSKGFMWFGTLDGLNKYDGYKITPYRHKPDQPNSISDNAIQVIFEDDKNTIWVGTRSGGISIYNEIEDRFINMKHEPDNPNSLSDNSITCIVKDENDIVWIGTNNGLNKYNQETKQFTHYFHDKENTNSLSNNSINDILIDDSGNLWIATDKGLNYFNPEDEKFIVYHHIAGKMSKANKKSTNKIRTLFIDSDGTLWVGTDNGLTMRDKRTRTFKTYVHNADENLSLSNNIVNDILEDAEGFLWIATQNGLNKFDKNSEEFYSYYNDPANPNSLSINHVQTLYQDRTNILWIGTSLGGINKWNRAAEELQVFRHNPYDTYSLSSNQIRTIYEDDSSQIWIGTVDKGLNRWNTKENKFIHYEHIPNDPGSISHNHIRSILQDHNGDFWIGTFGGGLNRFYPKTGTFIHFKHDDENPKSLSNDNIWKVYEDSKNNIWIATYGGGLNHFDPEKGIFTVFEHNPKDPKSISSNLVTSILEDTEGNLWIGTYGGGLNQFDYKDSTFTHFKYDENDPNSLGNNRIYSIVEDSSRHTIWIGTKGNLNKFDKKSGTFIRYDEDNGLPNDVIMGILEDKEGNLWISTNKGLSKFDPLQESFRNYDVRDGLQSNEFLVGSFCKARDGEMFFGGINGFNAFYPQNIKNNPHVPEIVITGFQIFNVEQELDSIISEKKVINLTYKENFISFDFVALDYILPEKNQYAYKMVGVDKEWNYVKNRRFATYNSLEPGKYTFKVIGSNNDEVWNKDGASVTIIIEPAFWQTRGFKFSVIGIAILSVFLGVRWRFKRIEKQRNLLEKIVKIRTAEILSQKEEIEAQRDEIEAQRDLAARQRDHISEQKKEITDSIIYAQRIQNATLPTTQEISAIDLIEDFFVLYKPKDIVSGDFYWVGRYENKMILIAADCTGHGVPGAFMSMLGVSLLNKIVGDKGISQPHEILNRLRRNIIASLHQQGKENEARDGMDIALCTVDTERNLLQFAGANNPVYIVREGKATIIKGDKMPIAIYDVMDSFSKQEFELQKGDAVYIFSDGYADQFGGPKGKKFKYKPFRELLIKHAEKPMSEQKQILDDNIEKWKAYTDPVSGEPFEQVDDIVVIGFRV